MESQYKLQLGDTKIVLKEMIEKGEKVDMIFTGIDLVEFNINFGRKTIKNNKILN